MIESWYSIGITRENEGFSCEFCLRGPVRVAMARKTISQRSPSICEECCKLFLQNFNEIHQTFLPRCGQGNSSCDR